MGNLPTYTGHTQIGMFCIAALLIGGASVERASIGNAFLGVVLFHLMFIVAPNAGAFITGDSMVGEYFRVFLSYGVITVALIMYEAKKRMAKSQTGRELAEAQVKKEDAPQLLRCYSDTAAVALMNDDNCRRGFLCNTLEDMESYIDIWQGEDYARPAVIDKRTGEAVGTLEIFGGETSVLRGGPAY